ncbi:competence protein CoiA [Cytobacillus dafuensis]|uniref:competence protein CoiA n=1 Tax=Cytobacillus dafuensis TaxID=1742359 RepID=UPI00070DA8CB|nr:competence protein CoiA family protein [Cytobacillus dafuensis]
MLVSKTKHGDWFSLTSIRNGERLKEIRKKESFYCPECEEEVILKIGSKRIPHFAHKKDASCSESYERESEYHLKGKLRLFEWLNSLGLTPQLEPFYKEISQRPDVGFMHNGVHYAIEFQCSVIPEELFVKRTENYYKAEILPIWIMAGKNIKRKGNYRTELTGFDYLFLSKNDSEKWILPAFCPVTNTLIIVNHILPISVKNSIAQFSVMDINTASLANLIQPNCSRLFNIEDWQREIRKAKNITLSLYGSHQNKFLQELYTHSLIPSLLPPEIGLPVKHAPLIETPAIVWQSYLYMDLLSHKQCFSLHEIHRSFFRRVSKKDVKIRNLPLNRNGDVFAAVKEYIDLLVKTNRLDNVNHDFFKKDIPITIQDNQVKQVEMEREFYQKYGKIIMENLK